MKTLLYAPAIYRNDKGLWPPTTSSTWYYRWQKQLWNFFEKLLIEIIWKAGPRTSNLEDPIKNFSASNIRYSTRKIERELKKCDIVFVDFPSTPMFDARKAGKECYCITPFDEKWIREDCKNEVMFAKDFRQFKGLFYSSVLKIYNWENDEE